MDEKICGWGVNDADFVVRPTIYNKREIVPTYRKWSNMLTRVLDEKELLRHPEYRKISICEEWKYYTNFHNWMTNYIGDIGDIEGLELDKDVYIPDNKIYSPHTCCFVSKDINDLFRDNSRTKKSGLPENIFTSPPNSYRAVYLGKYLGSGKDIEKLLELVNTAKANYYEELAETQTDIRVITGLLRHADLLQFGSYDF